MDKNKRKRGTLPLCDGTALTRQAWPSVTELSQQFTLAIVDLARLQTLLARTTATVVDSGWLTDVEMHQFACYNLEKRKIEWLGGRLAAKYAALQTGGITINIATGADMGKMIAIVPNGTGKPEISWQDGHSPNCRLHVSISHGGRRAGALVADRPCGIDIQSITPTVERVQERFVYADDRQALNAIDRLYGIQAALTAIWSAKEAVKKAAPGPEMPGFQAIGLHGLRREARGLQMSATVAAANGREEILMPVWFRKSGGTMLAFTMTGEEKNDENS
ncbi:MAG: 4'-phosphopantetheinyl transferase family protein [Thermodesulfobacteriota bacterium]